MSQNPEFKGERFQCPHCGVVSQQRWMDNLSVAKDTIGGIQHLYLNYRGEVADYQQAAIDTFLRKAGGQIQAYVKSLVPDDISASTCVACSAVAIWVGNSVVFPAQSQLDPPNADLSAEVQALYNEAAAIHASSPKGAAALLRLAVQVLLKDLGQPGNNINDDIAALVADGLSPRIQKALDILRVVGNNAVHPGQIDLDDDRDIASKLFRALNFIAEEMITKPKELDSIYEDILPERDRNNIDRRDGNGT